MKVCGVEIKGNEVNLCLLSLIDGLFHVPDCRSRKFTLADNSAKGLKHFQITFAKLIADYKVEHIVIRGRPTKGKFAGGAVGFKLEAALELLHNVEVTVMSPTDIKDTMARHALTIPFSETGLKQFQESAFTTAYAWLMKFS